MTLREGTMGWPMIATIGVSIVIGAQFSGWNYGLAGGWANMAVAAGLVFLFYVGLLQCVSELSATWPSAGGLGHYIRLAFGDYTGGIVAVALGLAMAAATGLVANFVTAYMVTVLHCDPALVKVALFAGIFCLHIRGAQEALWLTLVTGLVAILTIFTFSSVLAPTVQLNNLAIGSHPLSFASVLKALPYALWLFLGVEQAVAASEEVTEPERNLPRGLLIALATLSITAICVLVVAPGAGGLGNVSTAADPLLAAIPASHSGPLNLATLIGLGATLGLLASFLSVSYAATRTLYDVAREGFLPKAMTHVSARGTPVPILILVMIIAVTGSMFDPQKILIIVVILLTASFTVTAGAFIRLRRTAWSTPRAYTAFGGEFTAVGTLAFSLVIFCACASIDLITLSPIFAAFGATCIFRWKNDRLRSADGLPRRAHHP